VAIERSHRDFRTTQIVYGEIVTEPYVGFEHLTDKPDGWRYEVKRWCSPFDLKLPTLPRLADPSTQGIVESEYFKSGVGDVDLGDLYVRSLTETVMDNEHKWLPAIQSGYYFRYKTPYFYYSDNSRIQYVDPDDNDSSGRNVVTLDVEPNPTMPIMAASFRRHKISRSISYRTKIEHRSTFSGTWSGGEELETITAAGRIVWDNVDLTKKEFVIDTTTEGTVYLRFNRDFVRTFGVIPTVYEELSLCEFLGSSDGSDYQVYILENFPVIADSTFKLYLVNLGAKTWTEMQRVDTWFDLLQASVGSVPKYFVDRDLGIVYFADASCGGVPPVGRGIAARYQTTLRIEYEEADRSTDITAWDADTNPVSQHIHQGFVCVTHEDIAAAGIVLGIDKSPIPFVSDPIEYGPITVGSDTAILEATVTNVNGIPVPGTTVSFAVGPQGIGYLNGSTSSSGLTSGAGKAYSSYQPPVSANSLGYYSVIVRDSTHPSYTAHREVIISDTEANLEGHESSTYLYQILKDDLLLGYDGLDDWIYYALDTPTWVQDAEDYAQWKAELIEEYNIKPWVGVEQNGTISGRKVVVYQTTQDPDAIHPITGASGAIIPLRPELIEKITDTTDPYYGQYRLIYPEDAILDCDPDDSDVPVGGYWIATVRTVVFQAHCWSPYYNRTIHSNKIAARVSLPTYLLGEYVTEQLKKIPFGFKLPDADDSVASGLNGATFLTINPHSGSYLIIDLVGNAGKGEWADAPF